MVLDFHRYWSQLAAGSTPERCLFDPTAIPQVMPTLLVVELEPETARLRFRLSGTRADEFAGEVMAGRYLDSFFAGQSEKAARFFDAIYRRVAATGAPEAGEYLWPARTGLQQRILFGVFPFSVDGVIRQFFCVEDYTEIYDEKRTRPWSVGPIASS
ncbi:MAG: PAS domain-containing protein [Rhodospirillaceae bacterium]|nr:PAS domain-containing protein [Rhodospirillaceae bacterium]